MKLENEPGFAVKSPPRKSYNPFDSDDENTNGFVENYVSSYDIGSFEKNAGSLTFHVDDDDISWEEALFGHSHILSPVSAADANGEEILFREDTALFTDKIVTECELPEFVDCYKDNSDHAVKDIGIDEGAGAHDKVWAKSSDNQGSEILSAPLAIDGETNDNLDLRNEHQTLLFTEELKPRAENHQEQDASIQECAEVSMKDGEVDSEVLERHHSSNLCGTVDSVKVDDCKHDLIKEETDSSWQICEDMMRTGVMASATNDHQLLKADDNKVNKKGNEDSRQGHDLDESLDHVKEFSTRSSMMVSSQATTPPSESRREEATTPKSVELPVLLESAGSDVANGLGDNSRAEFGSIIWDVNYSSAIPEKEGNEKNESLNTMSNSKIPPESHATPPTEKPPKIQAMARHDDGAPGTEKWIHGETSFSAEFPPPASITYMGSNARCGSTSLRSDSSTGSTRSFAFPVLQAEWNSSPVRMAKADRRHVHKDRGWIHSLICCRF